MHQALRLLAGLGDADLDWIFRAGTEQRVTADTPLVVEGAQPEALFFVLEGVFEVQLDALGRRPLARLGSGELIGEMAFLTGEPSSATVLAGEDSLVLVLARKELDAHVAADPAFAARLYRAFAMIAGRRLRERVADLGGGALTAPGAVASAAERAWQVVSAAIERFQASIAEADAAALRAGDRVPEAIAERTRREFSALVRLVNDGIGDVSPHPPALRQELGRRAQRELLPYVLLSENAERYYSKPRGYAGDFLTIHQMYENRPTGVGRVGPLIDRCFLDLPTSQAVRNRRGLLVEEIRAEIAKHPDRATRVTSMACGPAQELFDVFEQLEDPTRLQARLIDIDFQALAFVADRRDRLRLRKQMEIAQSNLVYLALGRETLDLPPQDLIYSIGLIDYFEDRFVVQLLNYVHARLVPGGRVILGNFHPRNGVKAMMDHVVEWKLIHRTEEEMHRLFAASSFGRPCARIRFEQQGINLFAEGRKSGDGA